jgi:hypothetical protein
VAASSLAPSTAVRTASGSQSTQTAIIADLLVRRGANGFTAAEVIYQHGITRVAARIWELRQAGWQIASSTKRGQTARYWLTADPPGRTRAQQQSLGF